MTRVIVQDSLTDTFICHSEENASIEEIIKHIAKCCGVSLHEVIWKSENIVKSPKGTCVVQIGEIEFKQIILLTTNKIFDKDGIS